MEKSGNTSQENGVLMAGICFLLGRGWDFTKQNDSEPSSYVTPYDYSSIMHYGDWFASKNDEKTLVPKKSGVSRGNRHKKMSKIEVVFTLLRLILTVTTLRGSFDLNQTKHVKMATESLSTLRSFINEMY